MSRRHAPAAGRAAGFFERVYALVRRIPAGRVASYGQIAALLGNPRGARTVGWALRALPVGSDVPWHRVVSADGRIPTAGRADAAALQAALLRREGVSVRRDGTLRLASCAWNARSTATGRRRTRLASRS